MTRPDLNAELRDLKPFQVRTVDHAFHRLFEAPDGSRRFLVADEVGLGKTLVARGIIARAVDRLWGKVERIDVVYICSNAAIASANIGKLMLGKREEETRPVSTRLTMLATDLRALDRRPEPGGSVVNYVTFTPSTSFEMGHSLGRDVEREILYLLLHDQVGERRDALARILQGNVRSWRGWKERLKGRVSEEQREETVVPSIRDKFVRAYEQDAALNEAFATLADGWFSEHTERLPEEARDARSRFVGKARELLAQVCIGALEPDLIILDEFQRFRSLLETREGERDEAATLAHALLGAQAADKRPVPTLLLSATPYKLFTTGAEVGHDSHYDDFIATTRFLLGGNEQVVTDLRDRLDAFRVALRGAASGAEADVGERKRAVEELLRTVMARTERVGVSEDQDGMVVERRPRCAVGVEDVREYLAMRELFDAVGAGDPMPFWKSVPYATHFMRGYEFDRRLEGALEADPAEVEAALKRHPGSFLSASAVKEWRALDARGARLRAVADDLLRDGLWRLLWIPPTVPYWPLGGPFAGHEHATKSLLFSAWNVVPEVVSGVLSYEAERRMMDGRSADYQARSDASRPLQFKYTDRGAPSGHAGLLLRMPCLALADAVQPLLAPPGTDPREWARDVVRGLLSDAGLPDRAEGREDARWYWAAPVLLDSKLREFLERTLKTDALSSDEGDEESERADRGAPVRKPGGAGAAFRACIASALAVRPQELGRRPDDLAQVLADVALGSPAVVAARVLPGTVSAEVRCEEAARIAGAFGSLFNRPEVGALLRGCYAGAASTEESDEAYWRSVLRYCVDGNLQAVLDEQWHLAWESQSLGADDDKGPIVKRTAVEIASTVRPPRSNITAQFLHVTRQGAVRSKEIKLRAAFAARFARTSTEEGQQSAESVRRAFNSPFRPFVLASTSVGQEGLDFHPWCHRIVHWNLPGNPVDLEQREGRVNRFKCHAVRRNVAARFLGEARAQLKRGDELWARLFEIADADARAGGASELVPYWISPGPYRIERHVPMLPHSREVAAFERLRRQLAAYRVVFGQPRQEELLAFLDREEIPLEQLRSWTIDLSPPRR